MNEPTHRVEHGPCMRFMAEARGIALVSALLMLVVMTILGLAMFRSFGLMERMSGNTREKQRALSAASTAQTYAEWWLTAAGGANASAGTACNGQTATAQVCSNALTNPSSVSNWVAGVTYNPLTPAGTPLFNVAAAGTLNAYAAAPLFYISYLTGSYNASTGTQTSAYQIDAAGYAGTANTVAVVESTYAVSVTYTTQTTNTKFVNLGGP